MAGAYRLRVEWPAGDQLVWWATPDVGKLVAQPVGGDQLLSYEIRDPSSAILADGAPGRYNLRRLVQFSQFSSWAEVAHLVLPLFDRAAILDPRSPLHAEAAKIAGSTADPEARAAAALRLVQERIRYVYVGLEGGNYRPAAADETWTRRFGDCKAKAVVLIALLRELGIEGEPVLVHSQGADGADQRLPTPEAFDHVVVRAKIHGRAYWLDGTRLGDRRLSALPSPNSQWGLPLRSGATDLEKIPSHPPILPQQSVVLEIDASAGFEAPAKTRMEEALRGDEVVALRSQLGGMSAADSERAIKAYFRDQLPWSEATRAAWRYDEGAATAKSSAISGAATRPWRSSIRGSLMTHRLWP